MYLPNISYDILKDERFASLEHVYGDFFFNKLGLHPDLKYAVGYSEHDKKV